jgi:glucose-6-phosphate 1-epimerase
MPAITPDMSVLDKLDNQPEFKTWDYIANLVDDERIAQGQHLLKEHQPD